MQPQLHEHTKEEWTEYHRDQELEEFVRKAKNARRADPEPVLHDL